MQSLSIIGPVGYNAGSCGYCDPPGKRSTAKTSRSYGIWAYDLSPAGYQSLMDNGWRRSGSYVYRPDNLRTCCAQHTIRLEAGRFQPSKGQKRTVARLEKWVRTPWERREEADEQGGPSQPRGAQVGKGRSKGKYEGPWKLGERLAEVFWGDEDGKAGEKETTLHLERAALAKRHRATLKGKKQDEGKVHKERTPLSALQRSKCRRLETKLCPASCTEEKYALFRAYQMGVHKEGEDKVSDRRGFERFLCRSPIARQYADGRRVSESSGSSPSSDGPAMPADVVEVIDLKSRSPVPCGLYHMEYRLEGELVAVGVLDILPKALSSVYLFYEPKHADLQLGKISALREIALTLELGRKEGMQSLKWYYMGYYIHSCPKMRYKGDYCPSQLLDPATAKWVQLERITPKLDAGVRFGWQQASQPSLDGLNKGSEKTPETKPADETGRSDAEGEDSEDEDALTLPKPLPPGFVEPTPRELGSVLVLDSEKQRAGIMPFAMNPLSRSPEKIRSVIECLSSLPPSIDADFVLFL